MQMGDLSSTTRDCMGTSGVLATCLPVLVCRALRSGSDESCGSYGKWAMRDEEGSQNRGGGSRYCQSCKRRRLSVSSYLDRKIETSPLSAMLRGREKTYQHLWLVDVLLARRHR